MGRSRSRSRSRERRRRSRSRSRSRSSNSSDEEGFRVHVGDLSIDSSRREIEKVFEKFGPLHEVWLARNPPCFAFVNFRHKEDADDAVQNMNGKVVCGNRVKVGYALPRTRGRRQRSFDPNLRCYSCGERGHFSRDCNEVWSNKGYTAGYRRQSPVRDYRRRSRSRDRRRSRSRDRKRSRSRDRRRSRSRDRRRSRSRSRDRKRSRSRSRDRKEKRRRSDSGRDKDGGGDRNGSSPHAEKTRPLVPDYDEGHDK